MAWIVAFAAGAAAAGGAARGAGHALDEVDGAVRVHGSGLPVPGARVVCGAAEVVTDEAGRFALACPADAADGGARALTVSADGYGTVSLSVPDGGSSVVVRLVPAIEEIVVHGVREDPGDGVDRQLVTIDELRRVPGAFGDPIRALQSLPSVSRTGDLSGELVVRGAEGTNTAVYVDGMRVPFLYHFLVGRSVVDGALLEDVAFYAGSVPPRYPNVSQAVVDARIDAGTAQRGLHGVAHADLLDGGASFAANLGKVWTLRGSGRFGWAGTVATGAFGAYSAFTGANGRAPELTLPYEDHLVRLDRRVGQDTLSVTLLGAGDRLRYVDAGTSEALEDQTIAKAGYDPYVLVDARFFRARLRWDHGLAGRADAPSASAWLVGGRDVQQNLVPLLGRFGAGAVQDARSVRGTATAGFAVHLPSHRLALDLGAEAEVAPSRFVYLAPAGSAEPATRPPLQVTTGYVAPYVALPIRVGERGELTPAFRTTVHAFGEVVAVPEPQVAARIPLSRTWAAVGFAGIVSQGPKLNELGEGDPRALGVTRAAQSSLGVEMRHPKGVTLDLTAYATRMGGIVVRDTALSIVDSPPDPVNAVIASTTTYTPDGAMHQEPIVWHGLLHADPMYRTATGVALGGEVLLRLMPRGPQFGWVSASVGRSFRTVDLGEGPITTPSDADVPLALTALYGLGLPARWSASVRGQVASGLPFTPLEPVYAHVMNDPYLVDIAYFDYAAVPGPPNSDRYPIYARVDVRFDKTWVGKRASWTAYVDVYNVTNRHNPLWASYNWNYTELERTVYVPIVPTLGLQVEY